MNANQSVHERDDLPAGFVALAEKRGGERLVWASSYDDTPDNWFLYFESGKTDEVIVRGVK